MVHLRIKNKVVNYAEVAGWEIVPLHGLFGGHSGYGLHVRYTGNRKGTDAWDRVIEHPNKKEVEALLLTILDSVTEAEAKGGGIVSVP